jgi:hypothetical protein
MSFWNPKPSDAQKAAVRKGVNLAKQVDPSGMIGATRNVAKAAVKTVASRLPYGGSMINKAANTSGKYLGKMNIPGQKKAVKIFRRYTQGFD